MDAVDFMLKAPEQVKQSLAEVNTLLGKDVNNLNVPVTMIPEVLSRAPIAEIEVMKVPDGFKPKHLLTGKLSFKSEAAYAVVYGENKTYMSVAAYLVDRGVRNLYLVGARAAEASHKQLVAILQKRGCNVADIGQIAEDGESVGVFYADVKLPGGVVQEKELDYCVLISSCARF